jgi:SAM-dependent methyltransferase
MAAERLGSTGVPVSRRGLDAERLPFADASADCVLSTWTMCTLPDLPGALAEVRRVLRPGGTLHLVEHGLSPDPEVARWQRRLEPLQRRLAGGCHLTRQVHSAVEAAGLGFVDVETSYLPGAPRPFGFCTLGVASAE